MKALYRITNTCSNLTAMGAEPFTINYLVGMGASGTQIETNWLYERRAKLFYRTKAEAEKAGKRYLKKMQKDGFEI